MGNRDNGANDLESLSDDEIIEKIRQFRDDRNDEGFRMAIGVLAFRRYGDVFGRVRVKIRDSKQDAEDVAMLVIESAISAKFKGDHMGQFVKLLHVITDRRIADFYGKNRLVTTPIIDQGEDEGLYPQVPVDPDDEIDALPGKFEFEEMLDTLSDRHRKVVELTIEGHSAVEVADLTNAAFKDQTTPMSSSNVHQIMKRFRDDYKDQLEGGG